MIWFALKATYVSTHSRPKAAGDVLEKELPPGVVSTHSRPKAAGHKQRMIELRHRVSTHSRPKAAGLIAAVKAGMAEFQLTAARRRLAPPLKPLPNKACIALFR